MRPSLYLSDYNDVIHIRTDHNIGVLCDNDHAGPGNLKNTNQIGATCVRCVVISLKGIYYDPPRST